MIWTIKDIDSYYKKHNVSAKNQVAIVKLKYDFKKSKPYEDFRKERRDIIFNVLKNENRIDDIAKFTYYFTNISPSKLGFSHWESYTRYNTFSSGTKFDNEKINGIKSHILKIKRLERSINENGFRKDRPLLVTQRNNDRIYIDAGHHRLQAIRNLIGKGKLKSTYKIPCIVRFMKNEFNYVKMNYNGLTDYSFILDYLIKGIEHYRYDVDLYGRQYTRSNSIYVLFEFKSKGYSNCSVKKRGNVLLISFLPSAKKEHIPVILSFIRKKAPKMIIKVRKYRRQDDYNQILLRMLKTGIIDSIYETNEPK